MSRSGLNNNTVTGNPTQDQRPRCISEMVEVITRYGGVVETSGESSPDENYTGRSQEKRSRKSLLREKLRRISGNNVQGLAPDSADLPSRAQSVNEGIGIGDAEERDEGLPSGLQGLSLRSGIDFEQHNHSIQLEEEEEPTSEYASSHQNIPITTASIETQNVTIASSAVGVGHGRARCRAIQSMPEAVIGLERNHFVNHTSRNHILIPEGRDAGNTLRSCPPGTAMGRSRGIRRDLETRQWVLIPKLIAGEAQTEPMNHPDNLMSNVNTATAAGCRRDVDNRFGNDHIAAADRSRGRGIEHQSETQCESTLTPAPRKAIPERDQNLHHRTGHQMSSTAPGVWLQPEQDQFRNPNAVGRHRHGRASRRERETPISDAHLRPKPVNKKPWEKAPTLSTHGDFRAMVSHVISPQHFYIVLKYDLIKRHNMNQDLFREASFGMTRFDVVRNGKVPVVVVRHGDIWKRGRLITMKGDIGTVFLFDYGETITVNENQLKKPTDAILKVEPMAYRCSMNLQPGHLKLRNDCLDGTQWHPSIIERLKLFGVSTQEAHEKGLDEISVTCSHVVNDVSFVDIQIRGMEGTWGEHLVQVGLAVPVDGD